MFELRPFYWKNKKKINIYANSHTINHLKKRQDYLFKRRSHDPILKSNIIGSKFSLGRGNEKISFETIKVRHGYTNCLGYIFDKTAYISDCKDLSIAGERKLKNLNYLVIDCLKYKRHPSHFNLEEALYIHHCLQPKKTILTNMHSDLDYNILLKKLPKNVIPAYDGLKINL